jgi:hypothetical protein
MADLVKESGSAGNKKWMIWRSEVNQQKMKWLIWKREVAQIEMRNG